MIRRFVVLSAVGLLVLTSGCLAREDLLIGDGSSSGGGDGSSSGGGDDDGDIGKPGTSPSTFEEVQAALERSCALVGCHDGSLTPNLQWDRAYDAIVNVVSSQGTPYVTPGSLEDSYLWHKVSGAATIVGSSMPPGDDPSDGQVNRVLIRRWIEDGAPR